MKKNLTLVFIGLMILMFGNQAKAGTFTLNASEDAYYTEADNEIHNSNILYSRVILGNHYDTLLKFNLTSELLNALNSENIVSAKLHIYNKYTTSQAPDTKVYYLQNDSWQEGIYNTSVEAPTPIVYDANNPLGNITTNHSGNNNYIWVESDYLDVTSFLNDNNGIYSLLLSNRAIENSYDVFYSKEQSSGQYTPYLVLETAPIQESTTPAPEPSTMLLGFMSLAGAMGMKRKK